jgi:hypothetical protein
VPVSPADTRDFLRALLVVTALLTWVPSRSAPCSSRWCASTRGALVMRVGFNPAPFCSIPAPL